MKNRLHSGAAMLTALVFVVIVSSVVGGVATLTLSHFTREKVEADNAKAIQLAEAGINYELRYISENQLEVSPSHTADSPYVGSISGAEGQFTVWTTPDPDTGGTWSPPNPMLVHAIGTVGGVSRKVVVRGTRQSIFDIFALYGTDLVTFNGVGSVVYGDIGTNDEMNLVDPLANVPYPWEIVLAGPDADSNREGSNITSYPDPLEFPTIDTIITSPPNVGFGASGWDYLRSNSPVNRSNPNMRQFASTGGELTASGTALVGSPWDGTSANSVKIGSNDVGSLNSGTIRLGDDGQLVQTGGTATAVNALILPPGDYYFTDISTGGGTSNVLIIDNGGWTTGTPGRVRIWMNDSNKNDQINISVYYTARDPSLFRLYYNKCASISIGGNSVYWGGFYAVRDGCTGRIQVEGGSTINGSVLANSLTVSGGSIVNFPSNGAIDNPGDFSAWFGFKNQWREMPVSGSSVFPDGSSG